MKVIPQIQDNHSELTAWRRDIHAHPELGFEEERTAKLVADRLEGFGYQVERSVGGTGVSELGYKYNMTDISASFGLEQFTHIDNWQIGRAHV